MFERKRILNKSFDILFIGVNLNHTFFSSIVIMAAPIKVLCCGDINGKFQQVIKRVTTVNEKVLHTESLLALIKRNI